ncbi:MAG: molybdate ABC transporter substrate-binding protein [Bacteroidota bacterium]
MFLRYFCILLLVLGLFLPSTGQEITLAVAASVKPVIDSLASIYQPKTPEKINVVSGASGNLTTQILNGAPYDIFLSADTQYCYTLYQAGFTLNTPKIYAQGNLVILTRDSGVSKEGIQLLLEPGIKKIAIANPQIAPYGKAAIEALQYYHLSDAVKPKLIYGESIAQVNQFLFTKTVEAGITSASARISSSSTNRYYSYHIDQKAYFPISHAMVILKHAKSNEDAMKLFKFILSDSSSSVFNNFGFVRP